MGVVVVAGPSGSGKSRLARRLGWTIVHLDDFYYDAQEPGLPRSDLGIVDWDDPASWNQAAAIAAIAELLEHGEAEMPVYDIATSRRTGQRTVRVTGPHIVAEGIFAAHVVQPCKDLEILTDAVCIERPRIVTFAFRLSRDLRENRKPAFTLLRRGWRLMRAERQLIAQAKQAGCIGLSPNAAYRRLSRL